MPFVDQNEPWLLDAIERETKQTRDLLRKLRHIVEQGHIIDPPLALIGDLGRHTSVLANAIEMFTIRHDFVFESGQLHHSEYEGVMTFVAREIASDASLLTAPVIHNTGKTEYEIYREELGFSEREYNDLLAWKEAWNINELDIKSAFDTFSSYVVAELQAARYSIKVEDIAPGIAGVVGIALDVAFFASTPVIPALVSSCTTGIAAIAAKFPEIRRKLLGRGR